MQLCIQCDVELQTKDRNSFIGLISRNIFVKSPFVTFGAKSAKELILLRTPPPHAKPKIAEHVWNYRNIDGQRLLFEMSST